MHAGLQVGIAEGATRLERTKDVFREKVKAMLEAFLRELATMQEDFTRLQPTTKDGVSSSTALAFIAKWKGMVDAARQKVGSNRRTVRPPTCCTQCHRPLSSCEHG